MANFKKTVIPQYPSLDQKAETADATYWKNFESPVVSKEYGPISSVEFSPAPPHELAVTNSTRVQIYDSRSCRASRVLQRFQRQAFGGSFRSDGGLLVAGTEDGLVKVFDHANKSLLRTFKDAHNAAVHVTRFLGDNLHIVSGGDDNRVCLLDTPSESIVRVFDDAFGDYVRCGVAAPHDPASFLAASYDHRARLFDSRSMAAAMTVDHGQPVDAVLFLASGSIFLTAGGTSITAWDVLSGGRPLKTFSFHHKAITCLSLASDGRRILSGGLDKHVKVYDSSSFASLASIDFPSPILSLDVAADDAALAVGMADGLVSIKRRKGGEAKGGEEVEKSTLASSFSKCSRRSSRLKTSSSSIAAADQIVRRRVKERLRPYDVYFRKFQHSKALDAALSISVRSKTPEVTLAVMEELMRRERLRAAVAGRSDSELAALITFLSKNVSSVNFESTVLDVLDVVLEVYSSPPAELDEETFPRSAKALASLQQNVRREVEAKKRFLRMTGMMETVLNSA